MVKNIFDENVGEKDDEEVNKDKVDEALKETCEEDVKKICDEPKKETETADDYQERLDIEALREALAEEDRVEREMEERIREENEYIYLSNI